jgi:HAD superfamily hydrolase (TIGR01509 family)
MTGTFLFDFHGTLMRSRTWIDLEVRDLPRAAFSHLVSQGHIPLLDDEQFLRAEDIFRAARLTAESTYRETSHVDDLTAMVEALGLQEQVQPQLIEETVAALHRRCVPTVELMACTAETLQRLQDMGLRLGIVSNAAYAPFLTWTLAHFGILDFFEEIVVSADVKTRKPGLEIFRIAFDRMGLRAAETAYVGDDFRRDIVASKKIGMRAIWYRPDGDTASPDGKTTPDAIVTALDKIPDWAEAWRSSS